MSEEFKSAAGLDVKSMTKREKAELDKDRYKDQACPCADESTKDRNQQASFLTFTKEANKSSKDAKSQGYRRDGDQSHNQVEQALTKELPDVGDVVGVPNCWALQMKEPSPGKA